MPRNVCDLTQKLQESVCRRNNTHICSHRFHDDCCDLIRISLKQCLDAVRGIVFCNQCMSGKICRNTRTVRNRCCQCRRSCFYQKSVRMTVITSTEFDDLVTLRISPRNTDGTHRCLCSGAYQTADFHGWHQLCQKFCHLHFPLCRGAKRKTFLTCSLYLFDDTWIGMPQNPGSPGTYIVDHFISIHIGNMGTFCTLNKTRRTPYSLVRTYRAVHASRKPEFCSHIK